MMRRYVRVAVALRLGLDLGAPHTCRCGALVDARGQHGLVCKQALSRIARHQQLDDLVTRALVSALHVKMINARMGRHKFDGAQGSCWYGTSDVSTLADSCDATTARGCGEVAELAAARKCQKFSRLQHTLFFQSPW